MNEWSRMIEWMNEIKWINKVPLKNTCLKYVWKQPVKYLNFMNLMVFMINPFAMLVQ